MKYPEVLLIPLMMLMDYFLTIFCAIQKEKKYSLYFKIASYELNPIWQKQVAAKKWFCPRHLLLTALVSGVILWIVEFGNVPDGFTQGLLGCILVTYGTVLGRHVSNLLTFWYLDRRSDAVSGEIKMSHRFVLSLSLYNHLMVLIPVALIALFSGSWFAIGGVIGISLLLANHFKWLRKASKEASVK